MRHHIGIHPRLPSPTCLRLDQVQSRILLRRGSAHPPRCTNIYHQANIHTAIRDHNIPQPPSFLESRTHQHPPQYLHVIPPYRNNILTPSVPPRSKTSTMHALPASVIVRQHNVYHNFCFAGCLGRWYTAANRRRLMVSFIHPVVQHFRFEFTSKGRWCSLHT